MKWSSLNKSMMGEFSSIAVSVAGVGKIARWIFFFRLAESGLC